MGYARLDDAGTLDAFPTSFEFTILCFFTNSLLSCFPAHLHVSCLVGNSGKVAAGPSGSGEGFNGDFLCLLGYGESFVPASSGAPPSG